MTRYYSFFRAGLGVALLSATSLSAQAQEGLHQASTTYRLRTEAIALENGEGVPRNPLLAASLYCKAARLGDAQAQYNLGWMYANGNGVPQNYTTAIEWYKKAVENGNTLCEF